MKRLVIAGALVAGSSAFAVIAPLAHADDTTSPCPSGTIAQVSVHGNLNGTPVDQDICLPPAQ
ncbi:MAG TPA: hypothetical protein VFT62_00595 [Mycobacteriales bacterium]|nr:hypothetical protein [Mycobacteriales bacterium]